MSRLTALVTIAALSLASPAISSGPSEGYAARMKVTEGTDVVSSGMGYARHGDPVRMSMSHSERYGGEGGRVVETGFTFEMQPRLTHAGMQVEVTLNRAEVTDASTGSVREEVAILQGKATRTTDGWSYVTDKLPGGKVLSVTFKDGPRPE